MLGVRKVEGKAGDIREAVQGPGRSEAPDVGTGSREGARADT